MKRRLHELDGILLESFSDEISSVRGVKALRKSLSQLSSFEDDIDRRILLEKRINIPQQNSENKERKILRLFLRQSFYPQLENERAHFLLSLEGLVISTAHRQFQRGFGVFLQNIRVQVDRRVGTVNNGYANSQVFDWTEQQFPKGLQADVIQMKIPADKNCVGRISIGISSSGTNQVRISNQLRACFETLTVETTEEEIYTTLLQYVARNNLMETIQKDRKVAFRTDEKLKVLFDGLEVVNFSSVKSKLQQHLSALEPVEFEFPFNTSITDEFISSILSSKEKISASNLLSKLGGRVIDLEVFQDSELSKSVVQSINNLFLAENHEHQNTLKNILKTEYIGREIGEDILILHELQELLATGVAHAPSLTSNKSFPQIPLLFDLIYNRADGKKKGSSSDKYRVNQPLRTINTSLHALAGYLDVGSEELFNSSSLWLQEVCKSFENEGTKRVLSQQSNH